MEEEPKNNSEPVVESAKIIAAREWLRDEMKKYPQHRYIDSRTYDEFHEWCANYSEPFYEHGESKI